MYSPRAFGDARQVRLAVAAARLGNDRRPVGGRDLRGAVGRAVVDDDHLAVRPERSMPSHAWSTTAPTASSSLRHGITTEICGEAGGTRASMPGPASVTWASLAAVRAFGEVSSRLVRRAAALAETRRGVGIVFAVALLVWWLEALIIPLGPGRDFGTYLGGYLQLFHGHPIDLGYLLGRTPIATVVVGGLLDLWGGAVAEPVMSLLYAGSIVAWFLAARTFGGTGALLTVIVLVAYPGLRNPVPRALVGQRRRCGVRRLVASDRARSARAERATVCARGCRRRRPGADPAGEPGAAGVGAGPTARTARLVATRVIATFAFVVPAVALMGAWTVHNGLRYDNYTLARGGNATVPFYRAFVTDKIVRPSNGPASRELARAVQRELLTKEPYRSYGIDLDRFFSEASSRMQEDLVALSDREKGWKSNDRWLRDVGVEAVRAHPGRMRAASPGRSGEC